MAARKSSSRRKRTRAQKSHDYWGVMGAELAGQKATHRRQVDAFADVPSVNQARPRKPS